MCQKLGIFADNHIIISSSYFYKLGTSKPNLVFSFTHFHIYSSTHFHIFSSLFFCLCSLFYKNIFLNLWCSNF